MRFIKPRKPRGIKKNGKRSLDMCPYCLSFHCDPMCDSREWSRKKDRRSAAGVCRSCGQNPCICKSSLDAKTHIIKTKKRK